MKQVRINVESERSQGFYSNLMNVDHTKEEFVIDFITTIEEQSFLSARIIVNPHHLKRMIGALEENLKKYEETHGSLTVAEEPNVKMGFSIN